MLRNLALRDLTDFAMIPVIRLQPLLISLEPIAIITIHHTLKLWRRVREDIRTRIVHREIRRNGRTGEITLFGRNVRVTEREESAMCIGRSGRIVLFGISGRED